MILTLAASIMYWYLKQPVEDQTGSSDSDSLLDTTSNSATDDTASESSADENSCRWFGNDNGTFHWKFHVFLLLILIEILDLANDVFSEYIGYLSAICLKSNLPMWIDRNVYFCIRWNLNL